MKRLLLQILALFAGLANVGQVRAIELSQSMDKQSIAYEDQAVLTITLRWQGGQGAYLFDRPLQPTLEKLRVQQFATSIASQATDIGEVSSKTFTFALAPTGSGTARVEPITIHYVSWPDSIPGDLVTLPMTLTVAPAKQVTKSTGLSERLPKAGWVVILVVLIGGVGAGTLAFLKARRKPAAEVRTPATEFLERLTSLKADSGSDLKRFQTGLYKMLCMFVHDQYGIEVNSKTAEEIAHAIEASTAPESAKGKLSAWLLRADREKFTPLPPAPGETIRLEAELRQFFESLQSRQ